MPRGRSWYGPGFWKEEGWKPGMGGYRRGYGGWMGPDEEKAFLEAQVEELKAELSEMETRINELEKS